MKPIGDKATLEAYQAQGDAWIQKITMRLAHSHRYGWAVRVGGWLGPKAEEHATAEEAERSLARWVAESPADRVAFLAGQV